MFINFDILTLDKNEKELRTKSSPVVKSDISNAIMVGKSLYEYVKKKKDLGLAAPQIGTGLRIIAMNVKQKQFGFNGVMINPKIMQRSSTHTSVMEQCLSVPNIFVKVKRRDFVKLQFTDFQGKSRFTELRGMAAVVAQHEIDHLNGVLIVDYQKER